MITFQEIVAALGFIPGQGNVTSINGKSGAVSAYEQQILPFSASVDWDASTAQNAKLTATSNIPFTLNLPSSLAPGHGGVLTFVQFSTGGQVITWGAGFRGPAGVLPVLSVANNAIDEVQWYSPDGTHIDLLSIGKAFA